MTNTKLTHRKLDMEGHNDSIAHEALSMDMMMMQMTFYISKKVTVLFEVWDIKTTSGIVLTSLFWFIAAVLYQGLKYLRSYINQTVKSRESTGLLNRVLRGGYGAIDETDEAGSVNWKLHSLQTFLQVVQTGFGYLLMLVVMTFNFWLFIAVLIGDGVGYLIFQRHSFDNSDHCN